MAEEQLGMWTFVREVKPPADLLAMLVEGERPVKTFKTLRDVSVFTNKRIILGDVQGLTGKKVEYYSVPYTSITMWSSENAGNLDMSAELHIWTRVGNVKINLQRGVDIRVLDKLLAHGCLR